MRFKLDENLPRELADDLVGLGHEADTVRDEGLIGAEDAIIVQTARASSRILIPSIKVSPAFCNIRSTNMEASCCFVRTRQADDQF